MSLEKEEAERRELQKMLMGEDTGKDKDKKGGKGGIPVKDDDALALGGTVRMAIDVYSLVSGPKTEKKW